MYQHMGTRASSCSRTAPAGDTDIPEKVHACEYSEPAPAASTNRRASLKLSETEVVLQRRKGN